MTPDAIARKFLGDRVVRVTSTPSHAHFGEPSTDVVIALRPSTASTISDLVYVAVQEQLRHYSVLPVFVSYEVATVEDDSA